MSFELCNAPQVGRETIAADGYRRSRRDRQPASNHPSGFDVEGLIERLQRYAQRLTRNAAAADDLVQETLTRAFEKFHLWQQGTQFKPWLLSIMHNQYIDSVRRAKRQGTAIEWSGCEERLTCMPGQTERIELSEVDRAIAQLPSEQRSVILLIGVNGLRYEEAAALSGVPVGTIRSRVSRARASLRRLSEREAERA